MSQNSPSLARKAQRPPRINIKGAYPPSNSAISASIHASQGPHTGQTLGGLSVADQPYWPDYANPFVAGNFMQKGFEGFVDFTKSGLSFGEKFTYGLYDKFSKWSKKWFTHMFLLFVVTLYSVGGALLFGAIEGRQAKQEFIETHSLQKEFFKAMKQLSQDHELRKYSSSEFSGKMVYILREHQTAVESLLSNDKTVEELAKEREPWSFWNAMFYCGTIYTTIGYGHITPKTVLGQSLTIIYAIIGIPIFLILLADFGKLFTRALKFLWAYVRRLYYTGTCRRIRKQQQVRDAMTGFNTVYEAAIRRPSQFFGMSAETDVESQASAMNMSHPETPTSPYPETFEIDDEFNLPVSVASVLLISYILIGAFVYTLWEDWTYFEAFYFVFISMSTIGFGDFVPNHPIFMMCSIIYLIFGLALTSMFINVVQIKLSDTFKQASSKLGATIGLGEGSELDDDMASHVRTPSEIASLQESRIGKPASQENGLKVPTSISPLPSILRQNRPDASTSSANLTVPVEGPPPLPRRQVSMEEPPEVSKKKKRFFK